MLRMSFQEKMLWAQLAGVMIAVAYYARFLVHSGAGYHYFHALVIVLLIVFSSVRLLVRRRSSNVIEDERDRLIASMGARWSNTILWCGLVVLLVLYWDGGTLQSANLLIGMLFHLLVLAGCVRIFRELTAYRVAA